MNGFSDWFENNWIDLARLLVQLAIFAAVVRYGRKLLATLRASQEQVGALLKLSVSDSAPGVQPAPVSEPEQSKQFEPTAAKIWEPEPQPKREPEPEPEPVFAGGYSRSSYAAERDSRPNYPAEREQSLGGRLAGAQAPAFTPSAQREPFTASAQREEIPSLTPWVSAPALEPERLNVPAPALPARPSASSWLQAPIRSNSVSPWRKVVRWLQEPARR
jgi:hypothetical protein